MAYQKVQVIDAAAAILCYCRYGDMRREAGFEVRSMWYSLSHNRIRFIPHLVELVLQMTMIPETGACLDALLACSLPGSITKRFLEQISSKFLAFYFFAWKNVIFKIIRRLRVLCRSPNVRSFINNVPTFNSYFQNGCCCCCLSQSCGTPPYRSSTTWCCASTRVRPRPGVATDRPASLR